MPSMFDSSGTIQYLRSRIHSSSWALIRYPGTPPFAFAAGPVSVGPGMQAFQISASCVTRRRACATWYLDISNQHTYDPATVGTYFSV